MSYPVLHHCPICQSTLHVTRLECSHCHTTIENDFTLSKFASFSAEQMHFIEVFLVKRGNIKEVEKELGVSYPTVRGKLNDIITGLGHEQQQTEETEYRKSDIITKLENGKITAQEATRLINEGGTEK